jgi:AraC family transcriptional regulator
MVDKLEPGRSHGKVLKSFDTDGLIMTEIVYSARSRLSEHSHEYAHFCFVLAGTYTEYHDRQETECAPFTLTFRPPGEAHQDRFHNQEVRVFTIEIPLRWLERLQQDSVYLGRSSSFQGGSITRLSERIVREFHRMDTAAELIIQGLTLEVMAEAARHSAQTVEKRIPHWLKQAQALVDARFAENLTLSKIASEVGVHPIYLASMFRKKYQCTVGDYIRQLRIEYACREITRGETPLATIALEAGFANQAHFSSAFKRLTGHTPTAYRNFSRQS